MTRQLSRLRASAESVGTFEVFASCVALFCLAVSQPILDLLGRNPEFFLARSSSSTDILVLGIALSLIAPIVVGLAVIGIRKMNILAGTVVHWSILGLLAAILVVEIVERLLRLSSVAAIIVGGIGAITAVTLFYSSTTFRRFLKVLLLAPVAILVSFVVLSPLARLIFADRGLGGLIDVRVDNPVPIVMVVFDEFPVASLVDEEGSIQTAVYPNFARLSRDSYWFRNAVTNESNTERAIPAILTGARARPDAIPIVADYPGNIFTLLDETYDIDATEDLTDLCPASACQNSQELTWNVRWARTIDDLRIVALHVILPESLTASLTPIDQTWSDFATQPEAESGAGLEDRFHRMLDEGRPSSFTHFLDQLAPSGLRPSFDFIHVLLPHSPWEYLPDGTRHWSPQPARGTDGPGWGDDSWLIDQIYQRHLLQVQYTDTLLGQMLDRLQELDVYDETLIVVLADHGIVIAPSVEHRRGLTADSVGALTAVPLFIKPPGGVGGVIDDYRAEILDVVPTIAEIIDVPIPWPTEGASLLTDERPVRSESVIDSGALVIGANGQEMLEVALRKIEIFGPGSPFDLAPQGTSDLLWKSLSELDIGPSASVAGEISNPTRYEDIDLDADILPAYVQGILERNEAEEALLIAISVNGIVSAVTQSYVRDGIVRFQAIVPPSSFVTGENDLRLILVDGTPTHRLLSFIPTA